MKVANYETRQNSMQVTYITFFNPMHSSGIIIRMMLRVFLKNCSLWIMCKFAGKEKNTSRAETTGRGTSAVAESGQAQAGTEEGRWGSAHHGPRPGR